VRWPLSSAVADTNALIVAAAHKRRSSTATGAATSTTTANATMNGSAVSAEPIKTATADEEGDPQHDEDHPRDLAPRDDGRTLHAPECGRGSGLRSPDGLPASLLMVRKCGGRNGPRRARELQRSLLPREVHPAPPGMVARVTDPL
jgi:hypothetical protein